MFYILDDKLKNSILIIIGTLFILVLINFVMNSDNCGEIIFKIGFIYLVFVLYLTIFYIIDPKHLIQIFKGVSKENIYQKSLNESLVFDIQEKPNNTEELIFNFTEIFTEVKPTITTREIFHQNKISKPHNSLL